MINLKIDTQEKHEISPYLYMQFMEPLGIYDSSVDAGWDFIENEWKEPLINKVRELAPTMVRFGGCFASYYHWKEAVGKNRIPMMNYCWSGMYYNQVGTHEIMDFCRKVNSEPLLVVNMESDGRMHWAHPKNGTDRFGTAEEAAEWVDYCNNPSNKMRIENGEEQPFGIKYWQVGNETSYDKRGYSSAEGVEATKRFVEAMRKADPSITLIGWGDDMFEGTTWCRDMSKVDGIEHLAFHHHFDSGLPDSPLNGTDYRADWEKTWMHLMNAHKSMQEHIEKMRSECGNKRLAMTEGHFNIPGRNRNEVLSSWGAGVAYARCHNVIMRNSDILDIATLADFFGNVWQVNAIIIPTEDNSKTYMQPVGHVMSLFAHHQGKHYADVSHNGPIDVTASKTDNRIYLHIVNTEMNSDQKINLDTGDRKIASARMYCIAAKPETEITSVNNDCFKVVESEVKSNELTIPKAGVAAVEIVLE